MAEKPSGQIFISMDNLEKYGFSCFCDETEAKQTKEFLHRKLMMDVGRKSGNVTQSFIIPKELCIQLSQQKKITTDHWFKIRQTGSALEAIKLLSERAGWNQTEADLKSMIAHDPLNVFIATYEKENRWIPLGSGVSFSVNENMCWIGMILVHPELRRQGIAGAMMHACLTHARKVNRKSIVGLDATPDGKQVYEAMGFKDAFTIWRSVIATDGRNDQDPTLIAFDLELVRKFLEKKPYTERFQVLDLLGTLPGSFSLMFRQAGEVLGFVMSRPGRLRPFIGPLIADTPEVARSLLTATLTYWKKAGYNEVFMDIPEQHLVKGSLFERASAGETMSRQKIPVDPVRSFVRMYQLISAYDTHDHSDAMEATLKQQAILAHPQSLDFMHKEKHEIVPMMYGTSGPEWS